MEGETLLRYKDIIPDFDALIASINRPRDITIRWNPHKIERNQLFAMLRETFNEVHEIGWYNHAFKLGQNERPGKNFLHALGYYYVQEESAMVAPIVLAPSKNSFVLDMCAAPGGKTTQLSALMENSGTIIANDKAIPRLKSLVSNVSRLGCINVVVTWNDARNLSIKDCFDYVLLDAPCTAEGNLFKKIKLMPKFMRDSLTNLQKALLHKAIEIAKPGSTIVYCTCTFAPEENEGVIANILAKNLAKIEPVRIKIPHEKGLEYFGKNEYGGELKKAVRIYPYHLNSGGAFIAKLRKRD
ncbi:MAG: RsmB/NOP family class I SAM-dependent RNA methyltransferase [Candidatus Diapherotrites archaeon]|nr:RsmB/NOP family class I SAM-dependent RNA methyltransferase [Candidatus Diapherotrites archaeon]